MACQPRHTHETPEQIWYVAIEKGSLPLADEPEKEFCEGDVHGLQPKVTDSRFLA